MSSKADNEKLKVIHDKCQVILGNLLREEDNKYCVDCDAKGPRWASWNLGIFFCIRCAGIHRNLGVHISKVKSVNLDTWTAEQVACLQQMGNSQARAVYEANLPEGFRRPQTDSALEAFIRAKYEHKKYIAKEWVKPPVPKPAFDIEDDKRQEREKKKKGRSVEIRSLPPPQISRPVSFSIKPVQQELTKTSTQQVSGGVGDLLRLENSGTVPEDDIFAEFQSASTSTGFEQSLTSSSSVSNAASKIAAEEVYFFNEKSDGCLNQSNIIHGPLHYGHGNSLMSTSSSLVNNAASKIAAEEADFFNQKSDGSLNLSNIIQGPMTTGLENSLSTSSPLVNNPACQKSTIAEEEAEFFNQKSDGTSNKMTKESILSLYASNTSQISAATPQITPMYGLQGGLFVAQQAYDPVSMTAYHDVQQQMANLQLSGQAWNVAGNLPVNNPANTGGSVNLNQPNLTSNPPSGAFWPPPTGPNQNFANNFWQ